MSGNEERKNEGSNYENLKIPNLIEPSIEAKVVLNATDIPGAPLDYYRQLLALFESWDLISEVSQIASYEEYETIAMQIRSTLRNPSGDFYKAFAQSPWDYRAIEAEYTEEEIESQLPVIVEIRKRLQEKVGCSFRKQPANIEYLRLKREDGRMHTLRIILTDRSPEEIAENSKVRPGILPAFEGIKLESGETAVLIDWIEGGIPLTDRDKEKCLIQAESLLTVPVEQYDLWAGNFVIQQGTDKPYYVDQDAVTAIVTSGYVQETEDRKKLFEAGKTKMRFSDKA